MFPDNRRFNHARTDMIEVDTIENVINKKIDFIKQMPKVLSWKSLKGQKKMENILGLELEIVIMLKYNNQPLFYEV